MKNSIKTVPSKLGDISLITLTNENGASVTLSTIGAGIVSIIVPDQSGAMDDVVLGYKNPCDYIYDGPCAGKIPGRYANRIAKGKFEVDGKEYQLVINNGPNALHGGPTGFMNRNWNYELDGQSVVFSYFSTDGEEGYPGNLKVMAVYTWSESNVLTLDLFAETDKKTIVNLTNHTYFNLNGESSGTALNHMLKLNALKYLPTDNSLIPTGEMSDVKDTPMDFTKFKVIGENIHQDFPALNFGKGYDNCWVIDNWKQDKVALAAMLKGDKSGRLLEVYTSQPAVQVYTGNWLTGSCIGKSGINYKDYDAVAIECQGMPDAPNHQNFPSQYLSPGEIYKRTIIFKFS